MEGLAGLLDVLNVDHPAAVGPADEDVELGRHRGCQPGAEGEQEGSGTARLRALPWLGGLANDALAEAVQPANIKYLSLRLFYQLFLLSHSCPCVFASS